MKNIRFFYLKNCHFWVVKFSVYLNRRVFVMLNGYCKAKQILTRLAMQMRKKFFFFYLSIYFILFIYLFFFCFYFLQSAKACKRLFLIARSKFWSWLIEKKKKKKKKKKVKTPLRFGTL